MTSATVPDLPAVALPDAALPFLESIGDMARDELLALAERRSFPQGRLMLSELEPGEELLILLEGRAAVTIGSSELRGEEQLGVIGAGETVGEVALLTGALRSASVRALEPVQALALRREQLHGLMARFPAIASHFLRLLATRLATVDQVLATALDPQAQSAKPLEGLDRQAFEIGKKARPLWQLLARAFRELVVEHRQELPFYILSGFLGSFVLARVGLFSLGALGFRLEPLLRSAYVGGVLLLLASAGLSSFVYRRPLRRLLCLLFGIGGGLVVNELSVWLSFDVFYRDIFTRDPTLVFDPGELYHRSATPWAFTVIAVLLAQATYLSRFYRRAFYLLRDRWAARR